MKKIRINNMNCSHCAEKIKGILSKKLNIFDMNIDIENKLVVINPSNVTDEEIITNLEEAGYEATIV